MADNQELIQEEEENLPLGGITEVNGNSDKPTQDPESLLDSFREEWKRELEGSPGRGARTPSQDAVVTTSKPDTRRADRQKEDTQSQQDLEHKASELFNQGVELEQGGRLYEAIRYYRRAVNLVPDIEFKVHWKNIKEKAERTWGVNEECVEEEGEDLEEEIRDLVSRFQNMLIPSYAICQPKFDQEAGHISCLPKEMLEHILDWVVGSDLDMRSLEQTAAVCRGFYLVARSPDIWRRACARIWGIHCGSLGQYQSWRDMFIRRPHPRFNGCYISRTTYFRSGESSFQDQNYQPWHMVRYFRYLRFLPDGIVLMLTTSEEPSTIVAHLKSSEVRHSQVLKGHFRIHGSYVSLLFKRSNKKSNRKRGPLNRNGTTDVADTTFQIELEIRPVRDRHHWQMHWCHYTIVSRYFSDVQSVSKVDVSDVDNFPPLNFSRVRSYASESDKPLP
ncbi:F-box only protein 9 isoform X1 [Oratosquilla oratoria]|uniref:F-box only protein 9 isoform X1 n=1 Tax=Oratosquilla oratoria TaxID=337810 RepID=UPI003F775E37